MAGAGAGSAVLRVVVFEHLERLQRRGEIRQPERAGLRQRLGAQRRDPHRRVRFLHRFGLQSRARSTHRLARPCRAHPGQAFREQLALGAALHLEGLEQLGHEAPPHAQDHAPARELVQHRHLRGGLQRMAQRQQVAGGGKANAARCRGHRGQQHQRFGDGVGPEVVLGQPERLIAELFGEKRLARERFGVAGERNLPRGAAEVKVIHFRTTIPAAAGTRALPRSMRGRGSYCGADNARSAR